MTLNLKYAVCIYICICISLLSEYYQFNDGSSSVADWWRIFIENVHSEKRRGLMSFFGGTLMGCLSDSLRKKYLERRLKRHGQCRIRNSVNRCQGTFLNHDLSTLQSDIRSSNIRSQRYLIHLKVRKNKWTW